MLHRPVQTSAARASHPFKLLRVFSVLKLLKMAKGIRSLLDTVGEALPQVGNLGSLFFLLFFIFAALGVELFGRLGTVIAVRVKKRLVFAWAPAFELRKNY